MHVILGHHAIKVPNCNNNIILHLIAFSLFDDQWLRFTKIQQPGRIDILSDQGPDPLDSTRILRHADRHPALQVIQVNPDLAQARSHLDNPQNMNSLRDAWRESNRETREVTWNRRTRS